MPGLGESAFHGAMWKMIGNGFTASTNNLIHPLALWWTNGNTIPGMITNRKHSAKCTAALHRYTKEIKATDVSLRYWTWSLFLSFSRYVIECPNCAVIYRSRQYWYGNQDPVETVVRTEIQHIWPGVRPQWNNFNENLLKPIKRSFKLRI